MYSSRASSGTNSEEEVWHAASLVCARLYINESNQSCQVDGANSCWEGLQILTCMRELQVFIAHLCRRARLLNQGFQVALAQFLYLLHRSIAYKALILHLVFPETLQLCEFPLVSHDWMCMGCRREFAMWWQDTQLQMAKAMMCIKKKKKARGSVSRA